ncbi:MAG: GDSL-type esterase/lipase family protein [Planctomycetes bacterium]|nr:GDSL-type esterase/lipase family protein [Planctomycetota bacterium]
MPSVELSSRTRRVAFAAALAPAALALANFASTWRSGGDVAAAHVLTAVFALAWAASVFTPRGRALVCDIVAAVWVHVGFVGLALVAVACAVLASSDVGGSAFGAAAASALLLACGAWLRGLEVARATTLRRTALVGSCLVALVALDFGVRFFVLPSKSHNNLFIVHDPVLGWKLRPGASLEHTNELFTAKETIDSRGFRTPERPFAKPAGTKRVVVVGDSHAEAYTVDDDQTWLVQLERELSRELRVEVISLGVGGFSNDQELLAYLHYGRRFEPDLVILQTCANDPEFNVLDRYWRGKKPRFERHGELLMLTGVPVPDLRSSGLFSRELVQFSALALLAESIARQAAIRRDVETVADPDEAWRVTELLVRDLAAIVRSDGALLAGFDVSTKNVEQHRRYREIFAKYAIPSLDVDPIYVDEWKSYFHEGHWNEKGQRAAALALAPQVRALLERVDARPVEASAR